MLSVCDVKKHLSGINVLNGVSFQVEKGMAYGLAGLSGSGKSTLLRCIQGLTEPDSGVIECVGQSGFMFQDFQLFPHMTVIKNITYAPMRQKDDEHVIERGYKILKELGVQSKARAMPHALSGGQKQRVALARALMLEPDILLCDEPTSGLDTATIWDVLQLLKGMRQSGMTMLIASHDIKFLAEIVDRIIILRAGSIIANIEPSEVASVEDYIQECLA